MPTGDIADRHARLQRLVHDRFCSVVNRRRRATPVMTPTFENVSDIGVCLGLCLAPPAIAGVRSKQGAVQPGSLASRRAPASMASMTRSLMSQE
jgi:hypothetical protein